MSELILKARDLAQHAVKPLTGSLMAVVLTTTMLLLIDAEFHPRHIIIVYLLPVTMIAIQCGSMFAFLTALISSAAAVYFFLPPKLSFRVDDPLYVAELGFFLLLAFIAAKITALLMHDRSD